MVYLQNVKNNEKDAIKANKKTIFLLLKMLKVKICKRQNTLREEILANQPIANFDAIWRNLFWRIEKKIKFGEN